MDRWCRKRLKKLELSRLSLKANSPDIFISKNMMNIEKFIKQNMLRIKFHRNFVISIFHFGWIVGVENDLRNRSYQDYAWKPIHETFHLEKYDEYLKILQTKKFWNEILCKFCHVQFSSEIWVRCLRENAHEVGKITPTEILGTRKWDRFF